MKNWFEKARFKMLFHWKYSSQQGAEFSQTLIGGVYKLAFCRNIQIEEY
jgi:hypothetical protein